MCEAITRMKKPQTRSEQIKSYVGRLFLALFVKPGDLTFRKGEKRLSFSL